MLNIGQKVICINDDFSHLKDASNIHFPKFGFTYTIRRITVFGIALKEIINDEFIFKKYNNMQHEPMFNENRFMPLIENEVEALALELEKVL